MARARVTNEMVDKTPDVDVFASETDLALVQRLVDDFGVERVLIEVFGFNNKKPYNKIDGSWYEMLDCEHINRQGVRVNGLRYSGIERSDTKWLKGAMASEKVKMMARDPTMLGELESLK
jgi:hypothetical protein